MSTEQPGGAEGAGAATPGRPTDPRAAARHALETRLLAIEFAARFHNVDLDREALRIPVADAPPPAAIVLWLRDAGLWAKAVRLSWSQVMKLEMGSPVVLLLKDGSAAILTTVDPARNVIWVKDPRGSTSDSPVAVDELRLSQVWGGDTLLIRAERGVNEDTARFDFMWVSRVVMHEKSLLRGIFYGSVAIAFLAIVPALLMMGLIDKVLAFQSYSTLALISSLVIIMLVFESLIRFTRQKLTIVLGTRVDAKLNLQVFRRLMNLPLDFFEREQAGVITHHIMEVNKIRDFISGRLMQLCLDLVTLLVLLPVLFMVQPTLTWLVIVGGGMIAIVIMAFLSPVARRLRLWIQAETQKHSVLIESIHGIRTIKSLALEPQQREIWDRKVADSTHAKARTMELANWPATLTMPIDYFMVRGTMLIGVLIALESGSNADAGSLIAFMILSSRIASPLSGLARVIEDMQEVRLAMAMAGSVLNQKPESTKPGAGLRPRFEGGLSFSKVNYTYPGSKSRALDGITFEVPPGTMLGLVGKSGSGKSTITRMLQGISRDYEGYIKIDGNDIREINLGHMRRSFGVVLQENFLFRGTVRENIIAGRPGLTLTDAVRAARLAGAEEFIERMPNGYETFVQEGSPNLSGGQRQRLAIARGLIHDPRLLILDEATSALDPESEALVNANLQRIARGRTMVIVSHRLSSLTDCDQILVLDQGKMVDMAPHIILVERCSIYRQLWLQQNRHLETGGMPRGGMPQPVIAQGDD
jgi:HlyB family type I secretion system ABC transporter